MAKAKDVLTVLIPQGGWVALSESYEDIQFIECEPITKKQFEDGFKIADKLLEEAELQKKATKDALLKKLGITAEEAQLLLGGN
jgi:predicted RNA-binding protein associated with RNAse of E/G family